MTMIYDLAGYVLYVAHKYRRQIWLGLVGWLGGSFGVALFGAAAVRSTSGEFPLLLFWENTALIGGGLVIIMAVAGFVISEAVDG